MNKAENNSRRGFTLIELLVASSIGLIVILTMTSLFKTGMDATFTITQRAEVQQNMRAAIELMTQDISHAGAGLPTGGLQLATSGVSNYACYQTTCYLPTHAYPNNVGTGVANYMYGILPGYSNGVENGVAIPNASSARNDSITVVYQDYAFLLDNFNFTQLTTQSVQAAVKATTNPQLPTNILAPGGLNVGDVIFLYVTQTGTATGNTNTGNSQVQTAAVAAEITGISGTGPWTLTFNTGDPLNMNQTGGSNNLASAFVAASAAASTMKVYRLNVVSYFLEVPAAVTGGPIQNPRLMRQVNGQQAIAVADGIINLQFSYDVINASTGYLSSNLANPIASGQSPTTFQKVNIWLMGESLTSGAKKSQSMYLITSVAARSMSFCNSYSYSTTACAND
jgi:prepilin-type N-terminal cleavage/methylation domain-containing protein